MSVRVAGGNGLALPVALNEQEWFRILYLLGLFFLVQLKSVYV